MATDKDLTSAAGVHYVAFQLCFRDYAVGITSPGAKSFDLLATNHKTGKAIALQVKTMRNAFVKRKTGPSWWKWPVGKHLAVGPPLANVFLAFVDLQDDSSKPPNVFILPWAGLSPLVTGYPKAPKTPSFFWCDIDETDAPRYKDRWDLIDAALD